MRAGRIISGGLMVAVAGAALAAPVVVSPAALAQARPSGDAREVAGQASVVAERAAAAVARLAAYDLAALPQVADGDFRIAEHLLSLAHSMAPNNEGVLRRLMEAADAAGDRGRMGQLAAELVRLAPDDTVAQLRLISSRIVGLQNADARLDRYEAFLGPKGAAIDASVRSRLALDAALLLRERGDMDGFVDRLAQAIELDPTNKEAASLAAAFFSQRVNDPAGRLELLMGVLRADPLDPQTHLSIARELAAAGAYRSSARSYGLCNLLWTKMGVAVEPMLTAEMQLALWQVSGPAEIVHAIRGSVMQQREGVRVQAERARAKGIPPEQLPRPEDIILQPPIAMLAVAGAAALGDPELVDWALLEMNLAAAAAFQQLKDDAAAQRRIAGEVLWMRLLAGRETEEAAQQLQAMRESGEMNPNALARLEGWLLMRQGDMERAEARLRPLVDHDPLALLGLAVMAELEGDTEAAADWYKAVHRGASGTMASAYAGTRHVLLTSEPAPPAEWASRMEAMAFEGMPRWVDSMVQDPGSYMTIELAPEPPVVGPGEPLGVWIRIRNRSPIPLAVGPGAPIDSRLLLTAAVDVGIERATGMEMMEVVAADRRLRLMPQEAMDIVVRPELGTLWAVLNQLGDKTLRIRWRVLQGFVATEQGFFVQGPMGLTAESSVQLRQPLPMAMASAAELLRAIGSGDDAELTQAVVSLGWRWFAPPQLRGLTDDELAQIASALAQRYPTAGPGARMVMVAMLPTAARVPVMAAFEDALRGERDAGPLAAVLVSRVTRPDDPLLDIAASHADRGLAAMAADLRARLQTDTPTYSRGLARPLPAPGSGPGSGAMMGAEQGR